MLKWNVNCSINAKLINKRKQIARKKILNI